MLFEAINIDRIGRFLINFNLRHRFRHSKGKINLSKENLYVKVNVMQSTDFRHGSSKNGTRFSKVSMKNVHFIGNETPTIWVFNLTNNSTQITQVRLDVSSQSE